MHFTTNYSKIDGLYVPRLFFVSPYGRVLNSVKASEESLFKYYYANEKQLARNMKKVIQLYQNHSYSTDAD